MLKNHFAETVTIILSIVMGFIMAFAVIFIDKLPLHFSNVFSIWSMITMVILLVSIVMPYKKWSASFTGLFHLKEGSLAYKLVDNIIPSLILNTFNTVIVSAANILFSETVPASQQLSIWLEGILRDWPITFVISYIAAFIAEAIGKYVAERCCTAAEKV